MIELRTLGYFLCACEHEHLGMAAARLGVVPSTLSASLKNLEADLGVTLLKKRGSGVSPEPAARWLFRAGLPLLLLEGFARRRLAAPAASETTLLRLELSFRFTFGRVSKAVTQAIAQTAIEEPLVLVLPDWITEDGPGTDPEVVQNLEITRECRVRLEAVPRAADESTGETYIMSDPWLLVRRNMANASGDGQPYPKASKVFATPDLPGPALSQIEAYAKQQGWTELRFLDAHPAALPQLMEDAPGISFLLPSTAFATRLGMTGLVGVPLDPSLQMTVVGRVESTDSVAQRFLGRVRQALEGLEGATVFQPLITSRSLGYFNLAFEHEQVGAAARVGGVARPALSQQLRKLEITLSGRLFERRSYGLTPTDLGIRFAPMATRLERGLRELHIEGVEVSLREREHLSLGVLPSVSRHSLLISQIAEVLLVLRVRYPNVSFTVKEGSNKILQSSIVRGQVGLAIVDTLIPNLPRMPLATEDLVVISDPRHALLPVGPVRLNDLAALPLVLPTQLFGLRQILNEAARSAGVELRPRDEVDSLALLVTLLLREPVCTVLPMSAVGRELAQGELIAHSIIEPSISRPLYMIYSTDRSLTSLERDLIALLRKGLNGPAASSS